MEIAKNNGDTALVEKLTENGEPPYYGKDVTWKSAAYINYLSNYMARNPAFRIQATTPFGTSVHLNMGCLIKSTTSVALLIHSVMFTSSFMT